MMIGVIGLIAVFAAFRLMRMTTGKAAGLPLNKRAFFGYLIVMAGCAVACMVLLVRQGDGRGEKIDREMADLRRRIEDDARIRREIERLADELRDVAAVTRSDPGLVPALERAMFAMGRSESEAAAKAMELARLRLDDNDSRIAPWLELRAFCFAAEGKYDEVEWPASRALRLREAEFGRESVEVVDSLALLGEAAVELGRLEDAEALCKRGLGLTDRLVGLLPRQTPRLLRAMAKVCEKTNRPEEARRFWNRARGFRN